VLAIKCAKQMLRVPRDVLMPGILLFCIVGAGLVLGSMLEENFISSMIKADGRFLAFLERPIAGSLGVVTLLVWLSPLLPYMLRRRRN
jgi:putative tricarboxylic transport membrane protein